MRFYLSLTVPRTDVDVPGLYNTGVLPGHPTGVHYTYNGLGRRSNLTADSEWAVTSGPLGAFTPYTGVTTQSPLNGPWLADSSTSRWIGPWANKSNTSPDSVFNGPAGTYNYRNTFDLTGFLRKTLKITGRWAADDGAAYARLNSKSIAGAGPTYTSWGTFSATGSTALGKGTNYLDFGVVNSSRSGVNPSGVRVEFTQATAEPVPGAHLAVSQPSPVTVLEGTPVTLNLRLDAAGGYAGNYGDYQWSMRNYDVWFQLPPGVTASAPLHYVRDTMDAASDTFPAALTFDQNGSYDLAGNGSASVYLPYDSAYTAQSLLTQPLHVEVVNVPPVLTGLTTAGAGGGKVTLSGTIVDPGKNDSFMMNIDWGDGGVGELASFPAGTTDFTLPAHTFADGLPASAHAVEIDLMDSDGGMTVTTLPMVDRPALVGDGVKVASAATNPSVAADSRGNWAVAYSDGGSLQLRRYRADGSVLDTQTITTDYRASFPVVAMNGAGDYVVGWSQGPDGIYWRRSDPATPTHTLGAAVRADSAATAPPPTEPPAPPATEPPAVAINDSGLAAITWRGSDHVYATADGFAGNAVQVDLNAADTASHPAVGIDRNGYFTVAWRSHNSSFDLIYARKFIPGQRPGNQIQAFTFANIAAAPDIAVSPDGSFAIAAGRYFRQFGSDGTAVQPTELLLTQALNLLPSDVSVSESHVRSDGDGDYVLAWRQADGVYARALTAGGAEPGDVVHVDQTDSERITSLSLGVGGDGEIVVAWNGATADGTSDTLIARRLRRSKVTIEPVDAGGNTIADNAVIPEGGVARFRVRRSDVLSGLPLTVQISPGGSATPEDYASGVFTQPVTIPVGVESVIVALKINANDGVEENSLLRETLSVTAATQEVGVVVGRQKRVTYQIMDTDGAVVGMRTEEKDGSGVESAIVPDLASFLLRRTGDTRVGLTLDVDITGTAKLNTVTSGLPDGDYTVSVDPAQGAFTRSGSVYHFTFYPGVDAMDVQIVPVDDSAVEGVEWVHAEMLADPQAYRLTANPEWLYSRVGIIDDEIDSVRVNALDTSFSEAGRDEGLVEFSRKGIGTAGKTITINFQLDGTADGSDFDVLDAGDAPLVASDGVYSVKLPAGVDAAQVRLRPVDDSVPEPDERVSVSLAAGSDYVAHPTLSQAELRLIDDDRPTVTLQTTDPSAGETNVNTGTFELRRTGGDLSQPVVVRFSIGGTAAYGIDYMPFPAPAGAVAGTLLFGPNQDVAWVTVTPTQDRLTEGAETVTLALLGGGAYDVAGGGAGSGTVTIADLTTGGTLATWDWSMPDRYGLDSNHNGRVDLPNTTAYANPYADVNGGVPLFGVTFDAGASTGAANYEWSILDREGNSVQWALPGNNGTLVHSSTIAAAKFTAELAEDRYTVTLTIRNGSVVSHETQIVEVSDILILSAGDSFASGEGNPEVGAGNDVARWFGLTSLDFGLWADGLDDSFHQETIYDGNGVPHTITVRDFGPVGADHTAAHRSTKASSSLTAMALEASDPKSSVTYISVAQSGAEVTDGFADPKSGGYDDQYPNGFPESQAAQAKRIIGDRHIDSLMMVLGGNDLGFSSIMFSYVLRVKYKLAFFWDKATKSFDEIGQEINGGLARLPSRFRTLDLTLASELASQLPEPSNIFLQGYPDITSGDDGKPAPLLKDWSENVWLAGLQDALGSTVSVTTLGLIHPSQTPMLQIDADEAQHAHDNALIPLNSAVQRAAETYGWTYIAPPDFTGHGYTSSQPWVRSATESRELEGGSIYKPVGAAHPNELGHEALSGAQLQTFLGDDRPSVVLPSVVDVAEGGVTSLSATAAGGRDLRYEWDLNYNGRAFRPTPGVTDATASVSGTSLSFPAFNRVAVRVTDPLGRSSYAFADVRITNSSSGRVNNEVPEVNVNEPFRLNLQRLRPADTVAQWRVDWGDGSDPDGDGVVGERVPADWLSRTHVYTSAGGKSVQVWLSDAGGETPAGNATVQVIQDDPFPTVTIQTIDGAAAESPNERGRFRVTRTGSTTLPLSLSVSILGSATNGIDYVDATGHAFPRAVTIPFGQSSIDLDVVPLADNVTGEDTETLTFRINPSSLYTVGQGGAEASIDIADGPSTDLGAIAGRVFDDADGGGTQGGVEAGLAGWQVLLDDNGNGQQDLGERVATTDALGAYAFTQVPAGTHSLVLLVKAGWVLTAEPVERTAVPVGTTSDGQDFAVARHVTVTGHVFVDGNVNGVLDAGEAPRAGVRTYIDMNGSGAFDAGEPFAYSGSEGIYEISAAAPGVFVVRTADSAQWTSSAGGGVTVAAAGGATIEGVDLAERELAPTIDSLTAGVASVVSGGTVTLVAAGVAPYALDLHFYRESNGQAGLQTGSGGDTLVGLDDVVDDGWSLTFRAGLYAGTYTFYAAAETADGLAGAARAAELNVTGSTVPTVVSIAALTPKVGEDGQVSLVFEVRRSGENADDLSVHIAPLSGAGYADEGDDYSPVDRVVTIPAGQDSVRVGLAPRADGMAESSEQVEVQVLPGSGYSIAGVDGGKAQVTLLDAGAPPEVTWARLQADGPVSSVSIGFSNDVLASLDASDVRLRSLATGQTFATDSLAVEYDPTLGEILLAAPGINGGVLPDGPYELQLLAPGIMDRAGRALDGNGDGTAGDDYLFRFSASAGVTAPALQSISVNDGSAQRSQLKSLTLSFDRAVTLAAGAATLQLLNTGGSGSNDNSLPTDASSALASPTSGDGGKTWIYRFAGSSPFVQKGTTGASTGSLVDGIFTLSVDPAKVTSGGVAMKAAPQPMTFHRLFGDANGSKNVNTADYGAFRLAFGKSLGQAGFDPAFDFDNNGTVNTLDYGQFRSRFGKVFSY